MKQPVPRWAVDAIVDMNPFEKDGRNLMRVQFRLIPFFKIRDAKAFRKNDPINRPATIYRMSAVAWEELRRAKQEKQAS